MTSVTYKSYNARTGKESNFTKVVKYIRKYYNEQIDIVLQDGKTICVGGIRSELYGKNGNYLSIVYDVTII